MPDWSPAIANEFIAMAGAGGALTQMQLQKLVYIAHGWNLAISNEKLTYDDPEAWDYGPVYRELRSALRRYGREPVKEPIRNCDYRVGLFMDEPDKPARASLNASERAIVDRVFRDYGRFHAFQLSALTHKDKTPWSTIYKGGEGRFDQIPTDLIRTHFIDLARARSKSAAV